MPYIEIGANPKNNGNCSSFIDYSLDHAFEIINGNVINYLSQEDNQKKIILVFLFSDSGYVASGNELVENETDNSILMPSSFVNQNICYEFNSKTEEYDESTPRNSKKQKISTKSLSKSKVWFSTYSFFFEKSTSFLISYFCLHQSLNLRARILPLYRLLRLYTVNFFF